MKPQKLFAISISFILTVALFISFNGSASAQTASSSDLSCVPFSIRLQRGSRGSYVVWLQQVLGRYLNTNVEADGVFGRGTLKYVSDFQSSEGLEADGVVGAQTRAALIAWCGKNPGKPVTSTTLYPSYNSQFTMKPGQRAAFPDGMKIDLARIIDSRCNYSSGVNCVWAGEISATMRALGGSFGNGTQQIQLGTTTRQSTTISGYTFTLVSAEPGSITLNVSSKNNEGSIQTVNVGDTFTIKKSEWINLSGQSIKVGLEGVYDNSCRANSQGMVCTAIYAPVVKVNAILGGDVALPVPAIAVGQTVTLYEDLSITLKEITTVNGVAAARMIITSKGSNSGTAPAITGMNIDSVATDTARFTMYVDPSKYSSAHSAYFTFSATSGSLASSVIPVALATSYSNGAYTYIATNLNPSTSYSVIPSITYRDSSGVERKVEGNSRTFTTESANYGPGVRTDSGTNVTATTATLNGYAASLSGYSSAKMYFVYGTSENSSSYSTPQVSAYEGSYTANIAGLTPNTTYYFRAAMAVGDGTYKYGSNSVFKTGDNGVSTATVRTDAATEIFATGAKISGYITGLPDYFTTNNKEKRSFQYGTTSGFGASTKEEPAYNGTFTASLTGLNADTTYYFRAVINMGDGTFKYGSTATFKTPAIIVDPVVSVRTDAATGVNGTDAVFNGYITGLPDYFTTNNKEKMFFQYGTTTSFGMSTAKQSAYNGSFSAKLTTLNPGTTYYYRAAVDMGDGTFRYGNTVSFTTATVIVDPGPSLTVQTLAATNVLPMSAVLNGRAAGIPSYFTENNNERVYFQYGTTSNLGTSTKDTGAYSGDFNTTISGLVPGNTYYFRAVLKLSNGTLKYGTTMSFATARADG